jgi:hypothetical protein
VVVLPSTSSSSKPVTTTFTMRPQNQRATIQAARTQHKTNSDDVSAGKTSLLYRVPPSASVSRVFVLTDICVFALSCAGSERLSGAAHDAITIGCGRRFGCAIAITASGGPCCGRSQSLPRGGALGKRRHAWAGQVCAGHGEQQRWWCVDR